METRSYYDDDDSTLINDLAWRHRVLSLVRCFHPFLTEGKKNNKRRTLYTCVVVVDDIHSTRQPLVNAPVSQWISNWSHRAPWPYSKGFNELRDDVYVFPPHRKRRRKKEVEYKQPAGYYYLPSLFFLSLFSTAIMLCKSPFMVCSPFYPATDNVTLRISSSFLCVCVWLAWLFTAVRSPCFAYKGTPNRIRIRSINTSR